MRLFLAINPPEDVRRAIIDATSVLREAAPSLRWIDAARVHLTLKFLGEQPDAVVPGLAAALDDVARRHRPFAMTIGEVGAFPNFRRARVVWMGVQREPRLELLHHDVELAGERLGFALDGRAFRPHLTLARVPDGTAEDELRALSRASRRVRFEDTADVTGMDLMRSVTDPAGARYDRLHTAPLAH